MADNNAEKGKEPVKKLSAQEILQKRVEEKGFLRISDAGEQDETEQALDKARLSSVEEVLVVQTDTDDTPATVTVLYFRLKLADTIGIQDAPKVKRKTVLGRLAEKLSPGKKNKPVVDSDANPKLKLTVNVEVPSFFKVIVGRQEGDQYIVIRPEWTNDDPRRHNPQNIIRGFTLDHADKSRLSFHIIDRDILHRLTRDTVQMKLYLDPDFRKTWFNLVLTKLEELGYTVNREWVYSK